MPEASYASIEPLVADRRVEGGRVHVTFRAPDGDAVASSAALRAAGDAVAAAGLWSSLRRSVSSVLGGALGAGGGEARDDASGWGEEAVRAAVVEAFEAVADRFVWEPGAGRYAAAGAGAEAEVASAFHGQLAAAPVSEAVDRRLLGRLLVEVATVDGHLADEERAFVADFLDPALGTVDDLAAAPPLSTDDLAAASPGPVRETILMLAWALALSDERLAGREQERLMEVGLVFGVPGGRTMQLTDAAQELLLAQALRRVYAGGRRDDVAHAETMRFARNIGMEDAAAEDVDARYRRARGIA